MSVNKLQVSEQETQNGMAMDNVYTCVLLCKGYQTLKLYTTNELV